VGIAWSSTEYGVLSTEWNSRRAAEYWVTSGMAGDRVQSTEYWVRSGTADGRQIAAYRVLRTEDRVARQSPRIHPAVTQYYVLRTRYSVLGTEDKEPSTIVSLPTGPIHRARRGREERHPCTNRLTRSQRRRRGRRQTVAVGSGLNETGWVREERCPPNVSPHEWGCTKKQMQWAILLRRRERLRLGKGTQGDVSFSVRKSVMPPLVCMLLAVYQHFP